MSQDAIFWVVAAAMVFGVALLLAQALRRMPNAEEAADLQVYRDQLAEVDRDTARGILNPAEAARIRTEVSRRLLQADVTLSGDRAVLGPSRIWIGGGLAVVLAASFWAYGQLGAPGYPDLPLQTRIAMADDIRRNRPDQAMAEAAVPQLPTVSPDAELNDLMIKLRQAVTNNPDDLQGQTFLARYEAELGDFRAAARAQTRVVALTAGVATAEDHVLLADLLIRAARGYVSPEAEKALLATLQMDPENGLARFYSGLLLAQTGRPDLAFSLWERLLATSPPDAPWLPPLRGAIEGLATEAGVDFTLPDAGAAGPDAAAIAAARDMNAEDRQAMIGGMVEQLASRLATDGGTASEWARLITSLAVLGETDRARRILVEAQNVFAASPADLETLRAAAVTAGVAG